ncbi:hypothetical protein GH714_018854 [Hevea brasiliensis]|uniref:Uncharacterized protein n=1 Tax=Hevea brasiliensis TaxID=3981 RepID=A0A6A6N4J6_HEVBR|nr:hypothetical protein GH714_018854 [Hevea brasiliensis]
MSKLLSQALGNLKFLDLSYSLELTKVPDLSSAPNLEFLCLRGCGNLIEIPSSIGKSKCLKEVALHGCSKLDSLPQSICNLKSLTLLDISDCFNISGLPENIGNLELLKNLYISGSGIKTLRSSINQLGKLEDLRCRGCEGLTLPSLTGLSRIVNLCIAGVELPQTMRYKNKSGSSLSFRLDRPNMIGLSFFAVFNPKNYSCDPMIQISCRAHFVDESGHSSKNFYSDLLNLRVDPLYSEHVFLWSKLFDMEVNFIEASFQFCIDKHSSKPPYPVNRDYEAIIKCGVHPIFQDDCLCRDEKRSKNQEDEEGGTSS